MEGGRTISYPIGKRITQELSRLKHAWGILQKNTAEGPESYPTNTIIYWSPSALSTGILYYFALRSEPEQTLVLPLLLMSVALMAGAIYTGLGSVSGKSRLAIPAALTAIACFGFCMTLWRTELVAAPVINALDEPRRFEGWIEKEEAGPRLRRLIVRVTWMEDTPGSAMPKYIQLAAPHRSGSGPGRYVQCFATLAAPPAPVTPGGYDFARQAYFAQIGAVGFARFPCEPLVQPAKTSFTDQARLWLAAKRRAITQTIMQATKGEAAAGFVAALATGDENGIGRTEVEALRSAGLSHLLAVSGMNMTLVGGFVFLLVRWLAALIEPLTLRVPVRAVAGFTALVACACYWALTGGGAATTRAFIMAVVAFGAVMMGRPAFTLRGFSFAALAILLLTPEALVSPGFQMSFAATLALISAYEIYRYTDRKNTPHNIAMSSKATALQWVIGMTATTIVAGAATSPYSAYHFHTLATYGFLANLAASPIISLIVTPACILALILAPVGLSSAPLSWAEWGSQQIINIAKWASQQPDAVTPLAAFEPHWLLLITAGLIALCIGKSWHRFLGVIFVAIALAGIAVADKPIALISADGQTLWALTSKGATRSEEGGNNFENTRFRQAMGISLNQQVPLLSKTGLPFQSGMLLRLKGDVMVFIVNADASPSDIPCIKGGVIILHQTEIPESAIILRCPNAKILTKTELQASGGLALYHHPRALRFISVSETRGSRPWTKLNTSSAS